MHKPRYEPYVETSKLLGIPIENLYDMCIEDIEKQINEKRGHLLPYQIDQMKSGSLFYRRFRIVTSDDFANAGIA